MTAVSMKHNPAFLSQKELIDAFVVRNTDLELIIEVIRENTKRVNQHVLVIGPHGMGKTMLVLRTAACVVEDAQLDALWYPLVFSEESYEVSSAGEFWWSALFHLAKQTGDEQIAELYEELKSEKDDKRLYERSLACLMDFAGSLNKRLLVVVENLHMLLDDQISGNEGWHIRHTLMNEPGIMLLATAVSRFDAIDNSKQAMFELFKVHPLDPLDNQETAGLWESLTGVKVEANNIRPIGILTGGNPRLLSIISQFAVGATFGELMGQLTYLIDDYTNYFK
ncbi:MAG: hypothetical protein GY765_00685, partial [bacterium]|nr:hypothetical protein [bacterium]